MKKCSEKGCRSEAQFAKIDEEGQWCEAHSPIHVGPLHDLDELPCGGWDHIDGMSRCDSCERWQRDGDTKACDRCCEPTCSECLSSRGVCAGCREGAEMRGAAVEAWRSK